MVPDDLILNNTLQIVYAESNAPVQSVVYAGWPVLDDTEFVPVLKKPMAPADINFTLHVWFDVSASVSSSSEGERLMSRHMTTVAIEDRSTICAFTLS